MGNVSNDVEIIWAERPPELKPSKDHWSVEPGSEVLKQGTQIVPGALPLLCDILWEKHIPLKLRDGFTIYTDVFRPVKGPKVPTIISGGPYGKNGGQFSEFTDKAPWRFGIPRQTVSGLEKFEGVDPAYWVFHGYAVAHPDPRGVGWSEGDMHMTSTQDGEDNYDLIEWLAKQEWSNERVTMAGNSWLTQTQWFAGASKPPHLTCLTPFEGWTDFYNDTVMRGGIPEPHLWQWIGFKSTRGLTRCEDWAAMCEKYPTWNQYWEDRKCKLDNIDVPLFVVASWNSSLHTGGTFHGWTGVSSKEKWLRVHNSNEWPDLYKPENVDMMRRFLDHYMKDVNNGWEFTPKVQICVLNHGSKDVINRPEVDFPLPRAQTKRLFLDGNDNSMSWDAPSSKSTKLTMDAAKGNAVFTYTFPERTELTGYFALKLFISLTSNDDADLFVKWGKLSSDDQELGHLNIDTGYMAENPELERKKAMAPQMPAHAIFVSGGGFGRLRLSHRELASNATEHDPRYTQKSLQKVAEGEVVEAWVELRPYGIIFEKGQKIKLEIAGYNMTGELPFFPKMPTINKGEVTFHTGGEYDSQLVVPYVAEQ